ncbi:MAG: sensor histidine kinase [Proteobacteria bacterium]|nr:sensor histidine kinase [Pseudomonadota bacterium]
MIRDSLRVRLLGGAAVAILVALVLAGIGMAWLFQRHIELREAASLIRDGKLLAGALSLDAQERPVIDSLPTESRYAKAASGLYWQVTNSAGSAHSDSLWDQSLPRPRAADALEWRVEHVRGPFRESLLMVERLIEPAQGSSFVLIQVATSDSALRAAGREFNREMAASLCVLWFFLFAAAYLQVKLGLRPLALVKQHLEQLRRNPAARLPAVYPREIAPLADAINALADAREEDLQRARKRAGDLAHSLKTPLAALAAQTRRAREAGAENALRGVDRALGAIGATLETELARARAAAVRSVGTSHGADIGTLLENIISVVERTERGERIVFEVDIPTELRVPVAAEDLTELLGALVENAVRYAHRRVRISGAAQASASILRVEDDGPGIDQNRSEAVIVRGARLDEAGPGHGLGLAIVNDLVAITGGTIAFGRAGLGGLEVCLRWPASSESEEPVSRPFHWLMRR